jgi:hypothetical protein
VVHPKLAWVSEFQNSLSGAMGVQVVVTIEDHVDPLKKLVVLTFPQELRKGEYMPIQNLAHGFAKNNDCVLYRIRRRPNALVLEVLTKTRLGQVMKKNPLLG